FGFLGTFMHFDASLSERSKISAFPSKKYSQHKKVCVILVTLHVMLTFPQVPFIVPTLPFRQCVVSEALQVLLKASCAFRS
ncbi:hypothetical protein MJM99_29140, partial [Salmonella enterica subsp. enterica serovar Kentucky]|nr:hypothetical protein [Salmonella enterica subsp. enterica serovar Kentucky]